MKSNYQLLNKAISDYPIGAKFISIFGALDIVATPTTFFVEKPITHFIGDNDTVLVFCKSNNARVIYADGVWAKKITKGGENEK